MHSHKLRICYLLTFKHSWFSHILYMRACVYNTIVSSKIYLFDRYSFKRYVVPWNWINLISRIKKTEEEKRKYMQPCMRSILFVKNDSKADRVRLATLERNEWPYGVERCYRRTSFKKKRKKRKTKL